MKFTFLFPAGLFFILPCVDDVRVVDLRVVTFDVPPQEVCYKREDTAVLAITAVPMIA